MMDWSFMAVPFVLIALLCPLMMVGMIVGGWVFARGHSGSGSHGMMMCHGGHHHGHVEAADDEAPANREPQPN